MSIKKIDAFKSLFYPESIAIIGASSKDGKVGNLAIKSIISSSYKGKVHLVNPKLNGHLYGFEVYQNIDSLPEDIDLYLYAIPSQGIQEAFESSIRKGCKSAIIFTSGFKEIGSVGLKLEEKLIETNQKKRVKVIGPNSLGVMNPNFNLNATFDPELSSASGGRISIVSQSGGVGSSIIYKFIDNNLGISKFVSLGNQANIDFVDMLSYLSEDRETDLIVIWMEGISKGREFYNFVKNIKKPVIIYLMKKTEAGNRLAMSHTGIVCTSEKVYGAAFKQSGILQVDSTEELVDSAKSISMLSPPKSNKVVILTYTAGPSIIAASILEEIGIKLINLTEKTKEKIMELSPLIEDLSNPVDLVGISPRHYPEAIEYALKDENVSCSLVFYLPFIPLDSLNAFVSAITKYDKPTVVCYIAPYSSKKLKKVAKELDRCHVPLYNSPERAARSLGNFIKYHLMKKDDRM